MVKQTNNPIIIKKYANRRLYNTATGEFVTLEDLRAMVTRNEKFSVKDAKSGEDITSSTLAQIIADQEGKGEHLLPDDILRQIIAFYEQGLSSNYNEFLRNSMASFSQNADQFEALSKAGIENFNKFQQSIASMFGVPSAESDKQPTSTSEASEINELREEMQKMQDKLDRLSERD